MENTKMSWNHVYTIYCTFICENTEIVQFIKKNGKLMNILNKVWESDSEVYFIYIRILKGYYSYQHLCFSHEWSKIGSRSKKMAEN
jgi:hypothetical protein